MTIMSMNKANSTKNMALLLNSNSLDIVCVQGQYIPVLGLKVLAWSIPYLSNAESLAR